MFPRLLVLGINCYNHTPGSVCLWSYCTRPKVPTLTEMPSRPPMILSLPRLLFIWLQSCCRHQQTSRQIHNLFAPDRLIRRPQCIMITLTGEPLNCAPFKLIHRLQYIVITLSDVEIGLRCPSATCHYVTACAGKIK